MQLVTRRSSIHGAAFRSCSSCDSFFLFSWRRLQHQQLTRRFFGGGGGGGGGRCFPTSVWLMPTALQTASMTNGTLNAKDYGWADTCARPADSLILTGPSLRLRHPPFLDQISVRVCETLYSINILHPTPNS